MILSQRNSTILAVRRIKPSMPSKHPFTCRARPVAVGRDYKEKEDHQINLSGDSKNSTDHAYMLKGIGERQRDHDERQDDLTFSF